MLFFLFYTEMRGVPSVFFGIKIFLDNALDSSYYDNERSGFFVAQLLLKRVARFFFYI